MLRSAVGVLCLGVMLAGCAASSAAGLPAAPGTPEARAACLVAGDAAGGSRAPVDAAAPHAERAAKSSGQWQELADALSDLQRQYTITAALDPKVKSSITELPPVELKTYEDALDQESTDVLTLMRVCGPLVPAATGG